MKTYGNIINGKLEIDKDEFIENIKNMKDGRIILEIKPYKNNISNKQRNYYWGVVIELLAQETGEAVEDIHEVMKSKFIPSKTITIFLEEIKQRKSITKLNTKEMEDYMSKIRVWASQFLSCYIPDPNEEEKLKNIETYKY